MIIQDIKRGDGSGKEKQPLIVLKTKQFGIII